MSGFKIDNDESEASAEKTKRKTPASLVLRALLNLTCEVGLDWEQCAAHEVCVPRNNRARSGTCGCDEGFERDPLLDLVCLPDSDTRRTPLPLLTTAIALDSFIDNNFVNFCKLWKRRQVVSMFNNQLHVF